jgi:F0F1-type ATP synthase assembly protein I
VVPKPSDNSADRRIWMRMVSEYTGLAMLLPVSTFVGYAIGYLLDKAFGTTFLYLVFLILGIISGLAQLIRQVQKDTKE